MTESYGSTNASDSLRPSEEEAVIDYQEEPETGAMRELRRSFFEYMEAHTRLFDNQHYQRIYSPAKDHYGIDSPAFILPKNLMARHPYQEELPVELSGSFMVAINRDAVPDAEYINYLREHEYWEDYVVRKPGFNLQNHAHSDYKLPVLEQMRPAHRFATYKEMQAAEQGEKLDAYIEWWREFYDKNIREIEELSERELARISKNYGTASTRSSVIEFIRKNKSIKEATYQKIISRRRKLS